jgi:hypothetical protein
MFTETAYIDMALIAKSVDVITLVHKNATEAFIDTASIVKFSTQH